MTVGAREARAPKRRACDAEPIAKTHRESHQSMLGISELAADLGVKVSFVRRLVHERRIPYYKVGRLVRFDPDEVHRWLQEGRVDALW